MEIWPAIDLLGGNCVRLQQGDYQRDTIFSNHPAEIAERWFAQGSSLLHCVDLDGAKTGSIVNEQAIRDIVRVASGRVVQLGGGVRTEATIGRLLDLGLSRLVIGTAALKDPAWFAKMCQRFPGHLVLGLDEHTEACVAVVYTDIAKDGMMAGPNFKSLAEIQKASPFPVICSGGVTTLDDVKQLIASNTAGAIIGRSLYEGQMDLVEVLRLAKA